MHEQAPPMHYKPLGIQEGFLPARQNNPISARLVQCLFYRNRSISWLFFLTQYKSVCFDPVKKPREHLKNNTYLERWNKKTHTWSLQRAMAMILMIHWIKIPLLLKRWTINKLPCCFVLLSVWCTKQSAISLQDTTWTNLAKMKICTSWCILSWTVHTVQSRKQGKQPFHKQDDLPHKKTQINKQKNTQKSSNCGSTYIHSLQHIPGIDISLVSRNHRATLARCIAQDSAFMKSEFFLPSSF